VLACFVWLQLEMYSRKFGLRLQGKFGNLLKTRGGQSANNANRSERSTFLGDELSAGSFGCGDDFVEARITAQIIPARIQEEIAVIRSTRDRCDNFELLERALALAGPRVNQRQVEN
jgi:hypothetical protein